MVCMDMYNNPGVMMCAGVITHILNFVKLLYGYIGEFAIYD